MEWHFEQENSTSLTLNVARQSGLMQTWWAFSLFMPVIFHRRRGKDKGKTAVSLERLSEYLPRPDVWSSINEGEFSV